MTIRAIFKDSRNLRVNKQGEIVKINPRKKAWAVTYTIDFSHVRSKKLVKFKTKIK